MSASRWDHLRDAYNAFSQGKRLAAMVHASMPGNKPNDMSEANRARIERLIAHAKDAVACGIAALEVDVNAEVDE